MATVNEHGVQVRSLADYRALLEERLRAALGSDLALDPETPLAQIIGVQALALTELDEQLASLANGMSVNTATGTQLEDLANLFEITRREATYSRVEATLSGVAGTNIPAGSRARTSNGDVFGLEESVFIPSGGSVAGTFIAVESGNKAVDAGTLIRIETAVAGWETVTNANAGVVGKDQESNFDLRDRYKASTTRKAITSVQAIQATVLDVAGVERVRVEENATDAPVARQGFNIPAHNVMVIVLGGLDSDIADAIVRSKPAGIPLFNNGDEAVTSNGIKFQRVESIACDLAITISTKDFFEAEGIATIKTRVAAYFNTLFGIGDSVDLQALRAPIYSVLGATMEAIAITDTGSQALPATTPLNRLYTLNENNIAVTVA